MLPRRSTPTYVSRLFPNGSSNPNWILGYIGVAMNGAGVYSDVDGGGLMVMLVG
jgi:hypothetical protein